MLGIPYRNYIDGFIVFGARDTFGENLDLGILIWIKRKLDGFIAFFFSKDSLYLNWVGKKHYLIEEAGCVQVKEQISSNKNRVEITIFLPSIKNI